jgi:hypothetical protein
MQLRSNPGLRWSRMNCFSFKRSMFVYKTAESEVVESKSSEREGGLWIREDEKMSRTK